MVDPGSLNSFGGHLANLLSEVKERDSCEGRLTDKLSRLAVADTPYPREGELSHPSAGPDTTAPPTKQLFMCKHPEEEGSILIILQLRGPSPPVSLLPGSRGQIQPPTSLIVPLHPYLVSPAAHEPVTSPQLKP
ncbi:hypothetical protein EXN66_Car006190 [Channa argus]|uniref:Uncharacterized protein n=1 Tax=Channa argus TaxID=215402 RepID=A0A6G1PJV8_CHAAH|nr:hypothetical protein EXN66_Car006190 [Channa argus]